MQYKKLILSEIEFTRTFRLIAQAYEEIAVMKMRKVRGSVLKTREYLVKLSDVFFDVKKAHKRYQELMKKMKANSVKKAPATIIKIKQTPVKIKKPTVSVFLSANTSLYGDLIARIFRLFLEKSQKDNSDIIIIGRVGRRLYDESEHKKKYLYFELPDENITLESLKPVIYHLVEYQSILVYYGKFENMINQSASVSNVSGDQPYSTSPEEKDNKKSLGLNFLFEPSLETILLFFEDLIASSLFRQTVHETQLARLASRVMSMEQAQQNITQQMKKLRFSQIKINRLDQQKKQLERLSGISLWNR